jgi:hypothetical protein
VGWRGVRAYQMVTSLRHVPSFIVLSQKNWTGLQKKMEMAIVKQDQEKMKTIRVKQRMRKRRYGNMRKYCRRIENFVKNSPRL